MTNLEKLIEVLKKTFPGTAFAEDEIEEMLERCQFIDCKRCKMSSQCDIDPGYTFWENEYEIVPCIPEEKPVYKVGYKIMVDDEGNVIPYSGTIHPSFEHAMNEMDDAEYHGWLCNIEKVYFTEGR